MNPLKSSPGEKILRLDLLWALGADEDRPEPVPV